MKLIFSASLAFVVAGCATPPAAKPPIGKPNPAAASCIKQGGQSVLRKDTQGNVSGICVFTDGRECEQWALFRDHQCVEPQAKNS